MNGQRRWHPLSHKQSNCRTTCNASCNVQYIHSYYVSVAVDCINEWSIEYLARDTAPNASETGLTSHGGYTLTKPRYSTAPFNRLLGLKVTTFLCIISKLPPVLGFLPLLARFFHTLKVPNPDIFIDFPSAKVCFMVSRITSIISSDFVNDGLFA